MLKMTEKEKEEHLHFLYGQLDTCAQTLSECEYPSEKKHYNREYRRILKAIDSLEDPNKLTEMRKQKNAVTNAKVERFISNHRCSNCGGILKQTRSGSRRVVYKRCKTKYVLK